METNTEDFADNQLAAPLPDESKTQPLNDLSPNQTQSPIQLHFSINNSKMSNYKRGYQIITPKELKKLNRYSAQTQKVSTKYLKNQLT